MFQFFSFPTSNTSRETLIAPHDASTLFNLARLTLRYKFTNFSNFQCRPRCAYRPLILHTLRVSVHYEFVNVFKGTTNLKPLRPGDSWVLDPNVIEGLR